MSEENTFAKMQKESVSEEPKTQAPITEAGEIDINDMSDRAVGDKVKYVRPNLDGKADVIDKFQVFPADTSKEPKGSINGKSKSWKNEVVIFYKSVNEDGVQNREFISGARTFQQKDGGPSDISFWYKGATHQMAMLWESVAAALGVTPEELSPRQLYAFLNSEIDVTLKSTRFDNWNPEKGCKDGFVYKNMPDFAVPPKAEGETQPVKA